MVQQQPLIINDGDLILAGDGDGICRCLWTEIS
jgi:hypothetical protein